MCARHTSDTKLSMITDPLIEELRLLSNFLSIGMERIIQMSNLKGKRERRCFLFVQCDSYMRK